MVYGQGGVRGIRCNLSYREHKVLPLVEIRRIAPDFYTYSVRAGHGDACHTEDALGSLERCLNDAGDSLGHYFPTVSLCLDGQDLGCYSVQRLLLTPISLAAELLIKAQPAALHA